MIPRHKTSIKRKVMTVIMLASLAVLLVTVAAFLVYDLATFRRTMVQNITTQARIIADNSTATLLFRSQEDATNVLLSLRFDTHILAAAIYDAQGNLFAKYPADIPDADLPATPGPAGHVMSKSRLTVFQPVIQSGRQLGTLFLRSDLTPLSDRLELYGAISLVIMLGVLLFAFWLSVTLQRRISNPIIALAETARAVTGQRNFSVRAPRSGDDEVGDLTGAFNAMLDQIQTSHADLEKSRAQLQIVTDYASVLLCHVDAGEIFQFVNPSYAARFQLTPPQVVGRSIRDIVGDQAYQSFQHYVVRTLAGERVEFEQEIPYEHLGSRWMHCIYVPEKNDAGKVIGFVGVISEITERKRAELELKRARDQALAASRAKDDFLAALSHELRTPLSPVLLVASDEAANLQLPSATRASFEMIRRNVELEARLIDDLLDLTRIVRGKLSLDQQPLDVCTVLQDAIATIEADAQKKKISLVLDLETAACMVSGDAVRLQQIFWNVLKNAVKFTPAGGKITVQTRAQPDGKNIAVKITDTGIGLTAGEIRNIFDAFSQGDHAGSSGSHQFGGLGLGLAISRMLVELHAGTIRAASDGRNRGATFTIEFPRLPVEINGRAAPSSRTAPVNVSAAPKKTSARILLVEDHEPTRTALSQLLTRRDYKVTTAGNVTDALAIARQETFDLIISDIGLPDGNGYSLMSELRDVFGLKGIALTGYGMDEDVNAAQNAGFIAHLTKPIRIESLEKALLDIS